MKTVLIVVCFLAVLTVLPIISFYQADSTENIRDTPLFKRQISDATGGGQIEDNDVYYIGQDSVTINIPLIPINQNNPKLLINTTEPVITCPVCEKTLECPSFACSVAGCWDED